MKLIVRHLTSGLFYTRSLKLIPSLMATIVPLFWQLINLYGTAPTVFMIFCGLQMLTVGFAAIMYPLLFFQLSFIKYTARPPLIIYTGIVANNILGSALET